LLRLSWHAGISQRAVDAFCVFYQIELFSSIKPLFANKPIIVCVNKIDVRKIEELEPEKQASERVFLLCLS